MNFNGFITNNIKKTNIEKSGLYGYGSYQYGNYYEYAAYETYSKYNDEMIKENANIDNENNSSLNKILNLSRKYFKKFFDWIDK